MNSSNHFTPRYCNLASHISHLAPFQLPSCKVRYCICKGKCQEIFSIKKRRRNPQKRRSLIICSTKLFLTILSVFRIVARDEFAHCCDTDCIFFLQIFHSYFNFLVFCEDFRLSSDYHQLCQLLHFLIYHLFSGFHFPDH